MYKKFILSRKRPVDVSIKGSKQTLEFRNEVSSICNARRYNNLRCQRKIRNVRRYLRYRRVYECNISKNKTLSDKRILLNMP